MDGWGSTKSVIALPIAVAAPAAPHQLRSQLLHVRTKRTVGSDQLIHYYCQATSAFKHRSKKDQAARSALDLPKQQRASKIWLHRHRFEPQFAIATLEFPVAPFELLPVNVAIQSGRPLQNVPVL